MSAVTYWLFFALILKKVGESGKNNEFFAFFQYLVVSCGSFSIRHQPSLNRGLEKMIAADGVWGEIWVFLLENILGK